MALREREIVSMHKRRAASDLENYRPIALLSHVHKIIRNALDSEVREKYKFHDA